MSAGAAPEAAVSGIAPPPGRRLAVAAGIAVVVGLLALALHARAGFWPDYVHPWQGARHLLAGRDPFLALPGGLPAPFEWPLLYPLTTVLAAAPFAALPLPVASALTMALSAGVLAWGLTRDDWDPLWLLASAPFVMAVNLGQWSPLVVAAALLPSLGFLATLKPNLGVAVFCWRPDWRIAAGSAAVLLVSLLILPAWPAEWLRAVRSLEGHPSPVLSGGGAGLVLLVALARWRSADARLLLAMACLPQLLFFADQLPLLLVARTPRERRLLVACGLLAFVAWFLWASWRPAEAYVPAAQWFVLLGLYAPALIVVMRRSGA